MVNNAAYMFGGVAGGRKVQNIAPNNELYMLKLGSVSCDWIKLINTHGQGPQPRTQHSATAIDDGKLLIFGGYFSTNNRFNDVVVLDVATLTWSHPLKERQIALQVQAKAQLARLQQEAAALQEADASGDKAAEGGATLAPPGGEDATPSNMPRRNSITGNVKPARTPLPAATPAAFTPRGNHTESTVGAPEPRANHTADKLGSKLYVFGGQGGVGYSRKAFNDMFTLDLTTWEWAQVETVGTPPEPRGGHASCVIKQTILFYGGWNAESQFSDVRVFNTVNNNWSDPEISYGIPRWNHSFVTVEAIPSSKFFFSVGRKAPSKKAKFAISANLPTKSACWIWKYCSGTQ